MDISVDEADMYLSDYAETFLVFAKGNGEAGVRASLQRAERTAHIADLVVDGIHPRPELHKTSAPLGVKGRRSLMKKAAHPRQ